MNIEQFQLRVVEDTKLWFDLASEILGTKFSYSTIAFDLRGTCAGQAFTGRNHLRFNVGLGIDNLERFLSRTVPHEVAHIVANKHFKKRCCHGREWKWVMEKVFGVDPSRCHNYDVTNHRVRRKKLHQYKCGCEAPLKLGSRHHGMIERKSHILSCPKCKTRLLLENYLGFHYA